MVPHLRNKHPSNEVFISRLAPKWAAQLMQNKLLFTTKYTRPSGLQHLKMFCPFCECDKDFFLPYWSNHIRTHTGEYTNECILCFKVSLNATHCGQSTSKQKCNLFRDGLQAFICKRCNYVQIDEQRLISHVTTHHKIRDCQNEYQRITIIPALATQPKVVSNPNQILVQGTDLLAHLSFDN